MSASCSETNAVEALHDGRLAGERAESLRLHLVTCAACTKEAERLDALRRALVTSPGREGSPLQIAAGRRRLLEAATHVGRARPWTSARLGALALAACAASAFVTFGWHHEPFGTRPREATSMASARPDEANELVLSVTPSAGANWSRASSVRVETLNLNEGGLTVDVTRHGALRRLLVKLPDGEVEDEGTLFTVEVRAGKTHAVVVTSGRVALRLQGRPEQHLAAGESFLAADDATGEQTGTLPGATPDASQAPAIPGQAPAIPSAKGSRTGPSLDSAASCAGASLFQDGVQAFKRGEYTSAVSLLERFSLACGSGNHAEDAAYLTMVALARAGRRTDARAQAESYLERFPKGFRRKEAERLARPE